MGSVRAARHAGTSDATTATASSPSPTAANVSGSIGRTPEVAGDGLAERGPARDEPDEPGREARRLRAIQESSPRPSRISGACRAWRARRAGLSR